MNVRLATKIDLKGINQLNQANLKKNIQDESIITSEGYVSWEYPLALLQKIHDFHPSVVAIAEEKVVGYALILPKEARNDHPEFHLVLQKLDRIIYKQKPLASYNYYGMGQVCVASSHRGKGVFRKLFEAHKNHMQKKYDFVVTTISVTNTRSIRAHQRIGFKTIHEFDDHFGNWIVVLWDWK